MTSDSVTRIASRDNALLKELRRLSQDSAAYRKEGRIWLEGDHLFRAALTRGVQPLIAVFSESYWPGVPMEWHTVAARTVVLADHLFAALSALESPSGMGFVMALPLPALARPEAATVVLDRVQDAGNVGSILRSASAFGFHQVIALKGTAGLWSPKVVRAGMGAHFALQLIEGVDAQALQTLRVPLVTTSSHEGQLLQDTSLPRPCAWVFGHEGQGVGAELAQRAHHKVRIAQPGGEESLNVAAAAAICLHASTT
jgi:TrmH family RNA methyltransferase